MLLAGIQAWFLSVDLLLDTAHKARYDGCVDTNVEARWHDKGESNIPHN
jgi:hypothetical protein